MYYHHFWGYLRGAVQGHYASTNSPGSTDPYTTPSQQEVAKRQAALPCHIYIKEPRMLECRERLKQCKHGYF
jgi:hypothetical protein